MNPCFKLITTIGFCSFVLLSLALVGKNLVPKKEPICPFGIKNILIQMIEFALDALIEISGTILNGLVRIVQIPLRIYMTLPWWIQMGTDMGAGMHLHASLYGAPSQDTSDWIKGTYGRQKQESESSKLEKDEKEYPTISAITDLSSHKDDATKQLFPACRPETDPVKCDDEALDYLKKHQFNGPPDAESIMIRKYCSAWLWLKILMARPNAEEPNHPLNACRTQADPGQCTKKLVEFYKIQHEQFMSDMNYSNKLADEVPTNTTPAVNETLFPSCRPDSDPVKCDDEILDYYKTHRGLPAGEMERCNNYTSSWLLFKLIVNAPKIIREIVFSLHMAFLALVMLYGSIDAGVIAALLNLVFQIYIDGSVLMYLPFVLLWMRWHCGLFD